MLFYGLLRYNTIKTFLQNYSENGKFKIFPVFHEHIHVRRKPKRQCNMLNLASIISVKHSCQILLYSTYCYFSLCPPSSRCPTLPYIYIYTPHLLILCTTSLQPFEPGWDRLYRSCILRRNCVSYISM